MAAVRRTDARLQGPRRRNREELAERRAQDAVEPRAGRGLLGDRQRRPRAGHDVPAAQEHRLERRFQVCRRRARARGGGGAGCGDRADALGAPLPGAARQGHEPRVRPRPAFDAVARRRRRDRGGRHRQAARPRPQDRARAVGSRPVDRAQRPEVRSRLLAEPALPRRRGAGSAGRAGPGARGLRAARREARLDGRQSGSLSGVALPRRRGRPAAGAALLRERRRGPRPQERDGAVEVPAQDRLGIEHQHAGVRRRQPAFPLVGLRSAEPRPW